MLMVDPIPRVVTVGLSISSLFPTAFAAISLAATLLAAKSDAVRELSCISLQSIVLSAI